MSSLGILLCAKLVTGDELEDALEVEQAAASFLAGLPD
jgi:hypothetical protein